MSNNIPLLKS